MEGARGRVERVGDDVEVFEFFFEIFDSYFL